MSGPDDGFALVPLPPPGEARDAMTASALIHVGLHRAGFVEPCP
jgi:hypothetical protein